MSGPFAEGREASGEVVRGVSPNGSRAVSSAVAAASAFLGIRLRVIENGRGGATSGGAEPRTEGLGAPPSALSMLGTRQA
ncbi:hypothetical protein GCM10010349_43220 [Streptomyces flavofungini]|nr:hypothetical protein GCM10010349_43220 [Streptomyces flavofungini]